jgi:hypothetical protein
VAASASELRLGAGSYCWAVRLAGLARRKGQESSRLTGGSQSVRSSGEAGNDRGAKGRRKVELWRTDRRKRKPTRVPARASQRWNQPGAIDSGDTERLRSILGDEAKSRSLSSEHPPTGKPDAGEPPVRFGGRGGAAMSALPTTIPFQLRNSGLHQLQYGTGVLRQTGSRCPGRRRARVDGRARPGLSSRLAKLRPCRASSMRHSCA